VSEGEISPHEVAELEECFAAHARELFGYACVLAHGDRALAEDLVQAAFEAATRAWQALRSLADEQRRSWLRRTLAHIAVSGFRREAAFRDLLPRIEARYRKIQADPSEQAFSSIALERCWRAIQVLPPQQHAVAVMRWLLAMTNSQIAAALDIAGGTVAAHLSAVRGKLKAALGPYDPFGSEDGPVS